MDSWTEFEGNRKEHLYNVMARDMGRQDFMHDHV